MSLFRRYPQTTALSLACLLACLGLGIEYWFLMRMLQGVLLSPIAPTKPVQTQPTMATLPELPPLETFSAFVEQPLFVEGRRPLPEETKATANSESEQRPLELRLTGIIVTPELGQMILVQNSNNKTMRLKPGEAIDGWRIAELKDDSVLFERGKESHILKLIKPRPTPPAPPKASPHSSALPKQAPNPFAQAAAEQKKE